MNHRAKGNRARRRVIDLFEAAGWSVAIVERTGKFIKVKDAFGLFDLCAWRGDLVMFIQVTCGKPHSHKLYEKFTETHGGAEVLQMVYMGNNKWKNWIYIKGNKELVAGKALTF